MRKPPLWLAYEREGDSLHVVFEEAKKQDKSTLDYDYLKCQPLCELTPIGSPFSDKKIFYLDKLYKVLYKYHNMINLISISQARSKLPDLVSKINEKLERTVITVNGKPKVVMLSIDELESLEETAEVLTIPKIKQDLKMSRKQIKEGKFTPLSELK